MILVNSKFMNLLPIFAKTVLINFSTRILSLISICLSFGLCIFLSTNAYAEQALSMQISASKLVYDQNNHPVYIPVSTAQSGTTIQYRATYKNTLDRAITNTMVTIPIPTNTDFTGDAFPPSAKGTLDYHNYMEIPLMRMVKGKLVKIPFSEYKALRWDIKYIPAKKTIDVSFNTLVK